jgi:hypothetical protein
MPFGSGGTMPAMRPLPLSRALKREREGTHREAMGRVRVWQDCAWITLTPSPPLRGVDPLSRFKARERGLAQNR